MSHKLPLGFRPICEAGRGFWQIGAQLRPFAELLL